MSDLIERDDALKEIWEWIENREYQYTNATHWLQKRIEAIPSAKDKEDRKTENSSEIPNNCEHITEDGVTCAKYPACDDCLDNPLNKVKGSERLLKGKDEPQTEMTTEQVVNELLSIKKILDDGKLPKQRCGNCKHLTYRWNKTWCDIKCDNPHDMVCDKWERSE